MQPGNNGANAGSTPMGDEQDVIRTIQQRLGSGAPDLSEVWGNLPEAQMADTEQLLREQLPIRYRMLIYLYFKALSEGEE